MVSIVDVCVNLIISTKARTDVCVSREDRFMKYALWQCIRYIKVKREKHRHGCRSFFLMCAYVTKHLWHGRVTWVHALHFSTMRRRLAQYSEAPPHTSCTLFWRHSGTLFWDSNSFTCARLAGLLIFGFPQLPPLKAGVSQVVHVSNISTATNGPRIKWNIYSTMWLIYGFLVRHMRKPLPDVYLFLHCVQCLQARTRAHVSWVLRANVPGWVYWRLYVSIVRTLWHNQAAILV